MKTKNLSHERITAIFLSRDDADKAFHALEDMGYEKKEVTIIMSDHTSNQFKNDMKQAEIGNKALGGVAIGGAIGVVLGTLSAIGTVVLPGFGLVIAGPIAAALAGAGVGGSTGGLIGALIGWGFSEEHARKYEDEIKKGGIVLSVIPHNADDAENIEKLWRLKNGEITYH